MKDAHQRQESDEHVRLAEEVLHVELAADLASPVSLRTRIHLDTARPAAMTAADSRKRCVGVGTGGVCCSYLYQDVYARWGARVLFHLFCELRLLLLFGQDSRVLSDGRASGEITAHIDFPTLSPRSRPPSASAAVAVRSNYYTP